MSRDYKQVYNDFWKKIITTETGILNIDQIQRELADYKYLMDQVSRVYCNLVGLGKTHYDASTILTRVHHKYLDKELALDDLLGMADNGKIDVNDIREYLR